MLRSHGVTSKLRNLVQSLYSRIATTVRAADITGKWFEVNTGMRQRCKLFPLLFLLYMNKIVKDCGFVADVRARGY